MTWKKWLGLMAVAAVLALGVSPELRAQATRIIFLADGSGNKITSSTEGSLQPVHVAIVNPATDALATLSGQLAAPYKTIDLDESEEEVKATAGEVCSVWFTNTATSTRFVKFYNATAASTTVGTTTPVLTIGLPGNSSDDITGSLTTGGNGCFTFSTAISIAATTGLADNDTGAPATNDVVIALGYR